MSYWIFSNLINIRNCFLQLRHLRLHFVRFSNFATFLVIIRHTKFVTLQYENDWRCQVYSKQLANYEGRGNGYVKKKSVRELSVVIRVFLFLFLLLLLLLLHYCFSVCIFVLFLS